LLFWTFNTTKCYKYLILVVDYGNMG
jgi:hypothetical protein